MMWNWWADGMGWWMVMGGLWMLLFWGLVIWLIVWAIRKVSQVSKSDSSGGGNALEIAKAEFDQIKQDLS